jgi:hypothetical protein
MPGFCAPAGGSTAPPPASPDRSPSNPRSGEARELYGDEWEGVTTELIGMLRVQAGRNPDDPRMRKLVAELIARSALFRQ